MTAISLQPDTLFFTQIAILLGVYISYKIGYILFRERGPVSQNLALAILAGISFPIFMAFIFFQSSEPLIEMFRPFVSVINCLRVFIFLEQLGANFNFISPETVVYHTPYRRFILCTISGAQIMFTFYLFCVFFPIKLGNKYMHSLNGNIPHKSEIDQSGKLRSHQLGAFRLPKNVFMPTLNVDHNIKWGPGDKIINSVYNYFKGTPQEEEYSESYHTCEEEKSDLFSFISSPKTILILYVCTLLIFTQIQNRITRSLLIVNIGIIMALKFSGHFSEFTSVDLLYLWGKIPSTEDLEMDEIQPQGFVLDIPMFSGVLITSLTALSGYNAKQSF